MGKKICPLCGSDNIYEDFTHQTTIGNMWGCNSCNNAFQTPTIITEITNKIEKLKKSFMMRGDQEVREKINEIIDRINEEEE